MFFETNDDGASLLVNYLIFVALLCQIISKLIDIVVDGATTDLDHL